MTTRSGWIKAPWMAELRPAELPDKPPPGHLLLRVEACGICGSDLHSAGGEAKDWQLFGHEVAGRIEAVGPQVEGLDVGDKVVLETSTPCGRCDRCRGGRVELCSAPRNFWNMAALGFSDYMLVPAWSAVSYQGLEPEVACLAEPAGVAWDLVRAAGIEMGDRVAIVGPGPIGLMAIPLALRAGASEVVCIGRPRNQIRLDLAERWGARRFEADRPLSELPALEGRFDRVLYTAPAETVGDALALLSLGGILVYVGFGVGPAQAQFDAHRLHVRKGQIRTSFASPGLYLPQVLKFLKLGLLPGRDLISHRFGLEDLSTALNLLRTGKDETLKVIIIP